MSDNTADGPIVIGADRNNHPAPVAYEGSGSFLRGQLTSSAWSGWWYQEPAEETQNWD
ncbi:hypothetical protein [Arthrobacter sp. KNU40]|uniref:hypothetical protein n=1 Tax=Arthrobacter sp. KNU40 TaxID=3447965 RepID=UPI003F62F7DB